MKRIIFIILVIIWMSVVFWFSNQPAVQSSKESGRIVNKVLSYSKKYTQLDRESQIKIYKKVERIIRKLAHFTLYAIGGILIFLFINTFQISIARKIFLTILIGFIYASSDEVHQLFVIGRSGEVRDILIDTCGVIVGTGIVNHVKKIVKRDYN